MESESNRAMMQLGACSLSVTHFLKLAIFLYSRPVLGQTCPNSPTQRFVMAPPLTCGASCSGVTLSKSDRCRYNVSSCGSNVPSGSQCDVKCKDPFVGTPAKATCSPRNQVLGQEPIWTRPDCDLPLGCADPSVIPRGYRRLSDDDPIVLATGKRWACIEGYAGNAQVRCVPDDDCMSSMRFSGCVLKTACSPPSRDLINCRLDVSGCTQVEPGGSCPVKCRPPYVGWPSVAMCQPSNTDAEAQLLVVEPQCNLTCANPPNNPEGFVPDPSSPSGWACAPGYGGKASWHCVIDSVCSSKKVFEGCNLLQQCILPQKQDRCLYDFTGCLGAQSNPGGNCTVQCKYPYTGPLSFATCPPGNTNPLKELDWKPPTCKLVCDQILQIPDGYISHPYQKSAEGWNCVAGFAGNPSSGCTIDANCQPVLQLTGCKILERCVLPIFSEGERCSYDGTLCASVRSGEACNVTCRSPYTGGTAISTCPANNTTPNRPLLWKTPDCNLRCPIPSRIQKGYKALAEDGSAWACDDGYEGTPKVTCGIGDGCRTKFEFNGCTPHESCAIPKNAPCAIDWSRCLQVLAGQNCTVHCKSNYKGNVTVATCPSNNTDAATELVWNDPGCSLACSEDIAAPVGYQRTPWMCSANYSGSLQTTCGADAQCGATFLFKGCNKEVPCLSPRFGSNRRGSWLPRADQDPVVYNSPCRLNFTECQNITPGRSCTVRCGLGYEGHPTTAYCPLGNTDPAAELFMIEPLCSLRQCIDGDDVPPGYKFIPNGGWFCDDGYIGKAVRRCVPDPVTCQSKVEYSNCSKLQSCAPVNISNSSIFETCRVNTSSCDNLQPGTSCNVTCQEPFTIIEGKVNKTTAYCPAGNTNASLPAIWETPNASQIVVCQLQCPEPKRKPLGYTKDAKGNWICDVASGFSGQARSRCTVQLRADLLKEQANDTADANDTVSELEMGTSKCAAVMEFFGCQRVVPCDMPTFDRCMHEAPDCPTGQIAAGASCSVKCKSPFLLQAGMPLGMVSCSAKNTQRNGTVWQPPACYVGCSDVSSQVGYRRTDTGVWLCADGYAGLGAIYKQCVVNPVSCLVVPTMFGCLPFIPCATPVLDTVEDRCMIDMSRCLNLPSGRQCTMYCAAPYQGTFTIAACPARNVLQNRPLGWAKPGCVCPHPTTLPDGYKTVGLTSYECAKGWTGTANWYCIVYENCTFTKVFSGCQQMFDCIAPPLDLQDACLLNTTNCKAGTPRGQACNITCSAGHGYNSTRAVCPPENLLPNVGPDFNLTCKAYDCPDRTTWLMTQETSLGYSVGQWRCADDYRGNTSMTCEIDANCDANLQLHGCVKLQSCIVPQMTSPREQCRFNFTACQNLRPGQFCNVPCDFPFNGTPGKAFCPPDNMLPNQSLIYAMGDCKVQCNESIATVPPAYRKSNDFGWLCAPGYDGDAEVVCDVDDSCKPQLYFSGCSRLENCTAPAASDYDVCRYDFSDCDTADGIPPGSSCTISCQAPYKGQSFLASCPIGNVQPDQSIQWSNSSAARCVLTCDAPNPIPAGYRRLPNGTWICSDGFLGTARSSCVLASDCVGLSVQLSGCALSVPCSAPSFTNPCQYNVSNCSHVAPGSTCEIKCRSPWFVGSNTSIGRCPWPNLNPAQPLIFEHMPKCYAFCDYPPGGLPAGYVLLPNGTLEDGDVECAADAIGTAAVNCKVGTDANEPCRTAFVFSGCSLLQNCTRPVVDRCRVDLGNCSDVLPGGECVASCAEPFIGSDMMGSCSATNIDPEQPVHLSSQPVCGCPDPKVLPKGYLKVGAGYTCASGYTGSANRSCVVGEDCIPMVYFTGCEAIHSCAAPAASFLLNARDCQKVPSGETCQARCLNTNCVRGGPLTFSCPAGNTNASRPLDLVSGACQVACEVCESDLFMDSDPRKGVLTGLISFGAAHANGRMPVDEMLGYRIFLADNCGLQIGETLGFVNASEANYSCCATRTYSLRIVEVPLLPGATQIKVSLVTYYGELPFGTSVPFKDSATNASTGPGKVLAVTGDSSRLNFTLQALVALVFAIVASL